MIAGVADAGAQDVGAAAQVLGGAGELPAEVREVAAAGVAQLDALEVAPDALVGVEVGRVGGQALQVQALRRARRSDRSESVASPCEGLLRGYVLDVYPIAQYAR